MIELPIMFIKGERFYMDKKLGEYRRVNTHGRVGNSVDRIEMWECAECEADLPETLAVWCSLCNDGCEHAFCDEKCMKDFAERGDAEADAAYDRMRGEGLA